MMVTVYLKGPMKASRRLSPLTARVLGLGRASRHNTLAAGITGADGQLGGERAPRADKTFPQLREPAQGPGHQNTKASRVPGLPGYGWGSPGPQVTQVTPK